MRHERFAGEGTGVRNASPRARLALVCDVRQGAGPWKRARLTDLSETGFRIAWLPEYDASRPLRIRIPGIEVLSARICWREGRQVGCAFTSPLHIAVFENIIRAAGGDSA